MGCDGDDVMMLFAYKYVNFERPDLDIYAMLPVLALGLLMVLALILELHDRDEGQDESPSSATLWLCGLGLAGLIGYLLSVSPEIVRYTFNSMLVDDVLSRGAAALIAGSALLAILAGRDELERRKSEDFGEFTALTLGASLGMVLMAAANNTMVMFLGLELFSIALYLLCIFLPSRAANRESGMKYFLLSSAASGVLLYGLALLYGATGSTWLTEMQAPEMGETFRVGLLLVGGVFVLCGLLFKLAVVPFHFWAPDVYEGAPTSVTAFMSVATKVAALVALWRLFVVGNHGLHSAAVPVLASLAAVTILLGNLMALPQVSVKRMLAYSGVANAGYLLLAPISGPGLETPMMFFLASYLFGNIGAFVALSLVEGRLEREVKREDLKGLFLTQPWLAVAFGLCLVSLAGLPPAAGFLGKFYLFGKAIGLGSAVLPGIAIVGSLIGCAYYLGTAITLFDRKLVGKAPVVPDEESEEDPLSSAATALAICCAGILLLGIQPDILLSWLSLY